MKKIEKLTKKNFRMLRKAFSPIKNDDLMGLYMWNVIEKINEIIKKINQNDKN